MRDDIRVSTGLRRLAAETTLSNRRFEPFPIAVQSATALSLCFGALSCAEPVSTSAESSLVSASGFFQTSSQCPVIVVDSPHLIT